jgi:uncharacterized membrane protein
LRWSIACSMNGLENEKRLDKPCWGTYYRPDGRLKDLLKGNQSVQFDYVGILFRWFHILAAVTAVGGTIFMRMALLPSVSVLSDEQRKTLHEAVRSRWVKFVMGAILFLLVSGFYNFFMKARQLPAEYKGLYHALFGTKFLMAMVIFFVASALAGRSAAFDGIRKNARFWLTLNMVLGITVVCISGVMRAVPVKEKGEEQAKPVQTVSVPADASVLANYIE